MNSNELMVWASGHYLTENYPENWASMSEKEINNFIIEHVISPFEGHDPEEVMQFITDVAVDVKVMLLEAKAGRK